VKPYKINLNTKKISNKIWVTFANSDLQQLLCLNYSKSQWQVDKRITSVAYIGGNEQNRKKACKVRIDGYNGRQPLTADANNPALA